MKLDRNINGDGRGKYGLIRNRMLGEALDRRFNGGGSDPLIHADILNAVRVLEQAGIIDWGDTVDTEFFVIRLRDICAAPAIRAYAVAAHDHADAEYAREVFDVASRSGIYHPNPKKPD